MRSILWPFFNNCQVVFWTCTCTLLASKSNGSVLVKCAPTRNSSLPAHRRGSDCDLSKPCLLATCSGCKARQKKTQKCINAGASTMPKTTLWLGSCANTQTFAVSQNTGASHVPRSVLSFGMKKQRKYQHTTRHAKHAWTRTAHQE